MNSILYRPHIDGLRGVAIIAVVLYHAHLLGMSGGYVGVDVFFVISGFLIASIIARDSTVGTFSLLGFWERRIRRIVPALFVVVMCTVIATFFITLYPPDYHSLGGAVVAQSVFTSNMFFMVTDNYFDQPSKYSPLLHTWTLSVEEQFYVLFPLIVLVCMWLASRLPHLVESADEQTLIARMRKHALLTSIVILGLLSFCLSVWLVDLQPTSLFRIPFLPQGLFGSATFATAGFYILPTRMWEFALGIILALSTRKIRSAGYAEALGLGGIALIAYSVFLFNDNTLFPGIAALVPTLGAAAIIAANEHHSTISKKILSYPALIWIGLISYSLYLWHWPIFVLSKIAIPFTLSWAWMLALSVLSVLIGWLSYRFVETPFRRKGIIATRRMVFVVGLLALGLMAMSGYLIERSTYKMTGRVSVAADQIILVSQFSVARVGMCFASHGDTGQYTGLCRIGDTRPSKPDFVLWGDSHADAAVPLFVAIGWAHGLQGSVFAQGDCPPVSGVTQVLEVAGCQAQNALALQYIEDHDIKNIFLVARWSYYVMGGPSTVANDFLMDSTTVATTPATSQSVFEKNLTSMVRSLVSEGRNVYIVKQVPEQVDFDPREAFYQAMHEKRDLPLVGVLASDNDAYQALANAAIDRVGTIPGVYIIDPTSVFCKKDSYCDLQRDGRLLYRDENHLSIAGVMLLEPLVTPIMLGMRPR